MCHLLKVLPKMYIYMFCRVPECFFLKRGKITEGARSLWRKKEQKSFKKNKFEVLHMLQYRHTVAIITQSVNLISIPTHFSTAAMTFMSVFLLLLLLLFLFIIARGPSTPIETASATDLWLFILIITKTLFV